MADKKKSSLSARLEEEDYGYGILSALHGIIDKKSHKFLDLSNQQTIDILGDMWIDHMEQNQKRRMWKKHTPLVRACAGAGAGKAIIGIGGGPSFNKNASTLKFIYDKDTRKGWDDRDFIFFASNHQFKPLLKMGIFPDFVFLVDGADLDSVHKQLCVDVDGRSKGTLLVAPYHVSPKIAKSWTDQGRGILFFVSNAQVMRDEFRRIVKKSPSEHAMICGGNVMNTMWVFGAKIFGSKIFMCMGNDLSFPVKDTKKEQEAGYYADGDYSSNSKETGTGRDEAKCEKKWLSFELKKRIIKIPGKSDLEIVGNEIVGTSHSLWVYKTWIEESILLMTSQRKELGFHYYNCTEGGILGVMTKSFDREEMKRNENWYMLDEVCNRWHTTTLEHAATQYLQAKERIRWQEQQGVPNATNLVHLN